MTQSTIKNVLARHLHDKTYLNIGSGNTCFVTPIWHLILRYFSYRLDQRPDMTWKISKLFIKIHSSHQIWFILSLCYEKSVKWCETRDIPSLYSKPKSRLLCTSLQFVDTNFTTSPGGFLCQQSFSCSIMPTIHVVMNNLYYKCIKLLNKLHFYPC